MILKSIISGLCILAVIYGIVVKSRRYFNIGYFNYEEKIPITKKCRKLYSDN